jgi:curved DNA-binding protein CbpA
MISDYRILGIDEEEAEKGPTLERVKSAFRKRVKSLHPDLSSPEEALRNHDLFVEVCAAYERLSKTATPAPSDIIEPVTPIEGTNLPAPYADQAYAFYKQGMKAYMKIHPSQWNIDAGRMLNTAIAGREDEQEEIRRRVMKLVKLFPKAYYYFSIVVHEYPDSDWAYDAGAKMATIEERIGRYRKIIESFSSWNVDKREASRAYDETYTKMNEGLKAVRRDMPEDW